ncbi:MAG: LytTR family DNA-binding domain-containing protein [Pseudomonadota bacterium]
MTRSMPTALLAEDEPLLRAELRDALARLWPQLQIVGEAADGIEAARLLGLAKPDILFLDVRMPGMSGIDVARLSADSAHIVFLTAFESYAVDAFDQGAADYLLKPLDLARLALCVQRLQARLAQAQAPADLSALREAKPAGHMRWIQASTGSQLRFINIDDVHYFCADAKYTRVVTAAFSAHIRTAIKDLAGKLDADKFWQISRSAIINVGAIDAVQRVDGALAVRMRGEDEALPVSQVFQHRFRQM